MGPACSKINSIWYAEYPTKKNISVCSCSKNRICLKRRISKEKQLGQRRSLHRQMHWNRFDRSFWGQVDNLQGQNICVRSLNRKRTDKQNVRSSKVNDLRYREFSIKGCLLWKIVLYDSYICLYVRFQFDDRTYGLWPWRHSSDLNLSMRQICPKGNEGINVYVWTCPAITR